MTASAKRVLVFRNGSLGDTCIAIPALRLVRQHFSSADIRVLTNFPIDGGLKAAPLHSVIGQSGLVDGYFDYPLGLKQWADLLTCRKTLQQWRPEVLIYMMPVRSSLQLFRDLLYFKFVVGIPKIIGLSLNSKAQPHLWDEKTGLFEAEAHRLVRNLAVLGEIDLQSEAAWDLGLKTDETVRAANILQNWAGAGRYIVCSIGAKWESKDWGLDRWEQWAAAFSQRFPDYGLALIGSNIEKTHCDSVARLWKGPTLNLCGMLTPRESAWVIGQAQCFVGHDSGPMHLGAAVGTPCVALFSAQDKPGIWFPYGNRHQVIYHKTDCFGCLLEQCNVPEKPCMRSISVDEVISATERALGKACGIPSSIATFSLPQANSD
ncbi:glycosyltransferase family 9 protein [Candidatus Methylospira mobilis]|uniref:glycosyltransferase family 9 protein n=1 Tax=Candidatus Methylospira mobilis TaxID=1808979 RepID=UPI0028E794A0|nr:glycosyltransferase family 9 protein [Candidatus Methylospira mobilis]WNV03059.1 glycosyltransferase family 9 protein [Candidatus Methylospira mobilis]